MKIETPSIKYFNDKMSLIDELRQITAHVIENKTVENIKNVLTKKAKKGVYTTKINISDFVTTETGRITANQLQELRERIAAKIICYMKNEKLNIRYIKKNVYEISWF